MDNAANAVIGLSESFSAVLATAGDNGSPTHHDGIKRKKPSGCVVQLTDREVVDFLNSESTVRDGRLIGLTLDQGAEEWEVVVQLTFEAHARTQGDRYRLSLSGNPLFSYEFSSEGALEQIAFVKCIWTDKNRFYLSLDPWDEGDRSVSDQDNDCFISDHAMLTVSKSYNLSNRLQGQDRLDVWHDGAATCVIAVGSHGDPLDLGEDEVESLIAKLQAALAEDRA